MGHRVSCPELVGREAELAELITAFDAAVAGHPGMVLVEGDAGIGKTRLVDELCRRVGEQGALTAKGVCVPVTDGGLPYGPVAGIRRELARALGDKAPQLLGPLADELPAVGARATAKVAHQHKRLADEVAKTNLFEAILSVLTSLAARSPLVLVFDDLQWADSASAELLSFLIRNLADAPVQLLGTIRSDEVGVDHELRPWLAELSRHNRVTRVHLDGLSRDALQLLVAGILGYEPEWTLADAVWARSQGNPFFAEELTAAGPVPSLPPELTRVIMTRVEGLSKKTQQLLRIASIVGMDVEHRLLAAVADGFDGDALDAALSEAVESQVLVLDEARTGYRFRHALLRDAVDASLLPGERARLHRRVAEALTADAARTGPDSRAAGSRAAELAVHWWAAEEWSEAFRASVDAADSAYAQWGFAEALAHFERALAACDRMAAGERLTPAEHLVLLDRAADAAYLAGASVRSVELAQAAIDATDADADPPAAARRYAILGRNCWGVSDSAAATDAYRRGVAVMPAEPPTRELAHVLAEEARGIMLQSRWSEAEEVARRAIDVAAATGARGHESHAINTLGCCRAGLGHLDEGIELMYKALAISEEIESAENVDRAEVNLGMILNDSGRLAEAAALMVERPPVADLRGVNLLNGAAACTVEALIRLGRYADADDLILTINEQDVGICVSAPQLVPLPMLVRRGNFDEARVMLAEADEMTAGLAVIQTRGTLYCLAAELAIEEGRPDDAYEQVERGLALAVGTQDVTFTPRLCVLGVQALADRLTDAHAHGRPLDGDKVLLLADAQVQTMDAIAAALAARGVRPSNELVALAATCAAERSRLDVSDAQLWAAAADAWGVQGEPYPQACCRWREAEALLDRRAERARAATCLQEAWGIAIGLGARPLQSRIEDLARRARVTVQEGDASSPSDGSTVGADLGLTPREVEVLGQLAAGRTDREIADALFISKKTASVHVSNLLRKLDVANRVEAGRVGQAHGLG